MKVFALVVLLIGAMLIVVAFRGKQDNLITAVLGKPYGGTTLK